MKHDFVTHSMTSLYAHFGPHGRRDVHFHACMNSSCGDVILVGDGVECGGRAAPRSQAIANKKLRTVTPMV